MTNTELIRQEIDRLQEAQLDKCRNFSSGYNEGIFAGLSMLERFIDSLQQEQPEVDLAEEVDRFLKSEESTTYENAGSYKVAVKDPKKIARHFAKWGAEHTFTHHETDESLQEAVTHQMEDDQTIDDYVRKGLDEVCLRYAELGAKWGAEHRDRFLNWIRDLIKKGIEKPEEALNILKRIDALINDDSLWGEHLKKYDYGSSKNRMDR